MTMRQVIKKAFLRKNKPEMDGFMPKPEIPEKKWANFPQLFPVILKFFVVKRVRHNGLSRIRIISDTSTSPYADSIE